MSDFLFLTLGFTVGMVGTIIGAGGSFLLSPLFLFLFPSMAPAHLSGLGLLAVSANSASGTIGYAIRKQVHWPSVAFFSLAGIPGVLIGVQLSQIVPRTTFELIFAIFLLCISGFIMWRSFRKKKGPGRSHFWTSSAKWIGSVASFFIGVLASLLGIGGGIIHVPFLAEGLKYPIHLAAGTSHAVLAITSIVAVLSHLQDGSLTPLESFVPFLVGGLVVGAQLGAALSKKVSSHWILRALGVAVFLVSIRLFIKHLV